MDFSQNRNIMGSLWKLQDLKRLGQCAGSYGGDTWRFRWPAPRHLKWLDFGYNTQITGDLKDLQNLGRLGMAHAGSRSTSHSITRWILVGP